MTRAELLAKYPNASESFLRRNCDDPNTVSNPVPQPVVQHEPAPADARKEGGATCVKVRIVSFRRRLLDADNLAGGSKFIIDALRYAGLIRDDNPEDVDLSFAQVKIAAPAKEETVVMIQRLTISAEEAANIYAAALQEVRR